MLVSVYAYLDNHGFPLHNIHAVIVRAMAKDTANHSDWWWFYCGVVYSPLLLVLVMDEEILEMLEGGNRNGS